MVPGAVFWQFRETLTAQGPEPNCWHRQIPTNANKPGFRSVFQRRTAYFRRDGELVAGINVTPKRAECDARVGGL